MKKIEVPKEDIASVERSGKLPETKGKALAKMVGWGALAPVAVGGTMTLTYALGEHITPEGFGKLFDALAFMGIGYAGAKTDVVKKYLGKMKDLYSNYKSAE